MCKVVTKSSFEILEMNPNDATFNHVCSKHAPQGMLGKMAKDTKNDAKKCGDVILPLFGHFSCKYGVWLAIKTIKVV